MKRSRKIVILSDQNSGGSEDKQ